MRNRPGSVWFVVPAGIDDPTQPSGGNHYDRRVATGLTELGWRVTELRVAGSEPASTLLASALAAALAAVPDGSAVLIDGLIASGLPRVIGSVADRLRVVVLVHMPFGERGGVAVRAREQAALSAAAAVITTSSWTREWLLDAYGLDPARVSVAAPGVDPVPLAVTSPAGDRLLCVAAVTTLKGHDTLIEALAGLTTRAWTCDVVGSLDRDPVFVARLVEQMQAAGLTDRVRLVGPRVGAALAQTFADADVLVVASRFETYGMVVTEALARGLPVIASAVGGLPATLGQTADGRRPGMLVPAGDTSAWRLALASWLDDAQLRDRLHEAARERRSSLTGWPAGVSRVVTALVAAMNESVV